MSVYSVIVPPMKGIARRLLGPLLWLRRKLKERSALRDQLAAVGAELQLARARLAYLENRGGPNENAVLSRYRKREQLILLPKLIDLLPPDERFVIVDAGAREVDADPRWRPFPPERLRFIGFEPDAEEANRLNAIKGERGTERSFVDAGLWGASGTLRFEHNNIGGGSSFLNQNRKVTDRWKFENPNETALARDIFFPARYESIRVISLADWAERSGLSRIDFLKLNVQGGELEILRGAGNCLDAVLGILVEVAFVESYQHRPMFADVDTFLRNRNFQFFDLLAHHYIGRAKSPIAAQHLIVAEPNLGQLVSAWGQLIEGHALYLRDPLADDTLHKMTANDVIRLAVLAETYGQVEYAFELLDALVTTPGLCSAELNDKLRKATKEAETAYKELLVRR